MASDDLKIGFLSPNYLSSYEKWIWRQVNYLSNDITFIGVHQTINKKKHGDIPLINLLKVKSYFRRLLNKIRNKYLHEYLLNYNLKLLEKNIEFNTYYIHYLTQAYQIKETLYKTEKDIYIHCHGYDVMWDLKELKYPFGNSHSKEYRDFAKSIQSKVVYIANSGFTKKCLMEVGIKEEKIEILRFGVNRSNNLKKRSGKESLKILFLGRLVDCKGPHLTIKAFDRASKMGLNAELLIAGDGPMMTTCRILRNDSKFKERIKILGEVSGDHADKLFKECHIFTAHNMKGELSNQVEAYGVTLIEAMASGLPVVTGKSGGVMETVLEGKTGFLFTSGNIEEHAEKLYNLGTSEELRLKMGKNSITHIKEKFSDLREREELGKILRSGRKIKN
ncbi:MAG: glycosyltransferase family 4 protein [Acidobacteriota bacterium]